MITVRIIMLVYIASYDVPNEILLLVEFFFFRRGKSVNLLTLCDGDLSFWKVSVVTYPGNLSVLFRYLT